MNTEPRKTKTKSSQLVILILISCSIVQAQNLQTLSLPNSVARMSVDEESGAMYIFVGEMYIKIYERSNPTDIQVLGANLQSLNDNDYKIWYGQIIHNKNLAVIIE